MLATIWYVGLYQPVFNALIWIYNNWTDESLGWAIILMTIFLRIVLLPFTIVTEKARVQNLELEQEIQQAEKDFAKDRVLLNQEIRNILKKRKIRPWAKAIVLGVQLLVLILLYQVFLQGITGEKVIHTLYTSVDFPGKINTLFYGFELSETHTLFWPTLVGVFLFGDIYVELKKQHKIRRADMFYLILFPLATFAVLWWLPMVKSLFILTSIVFSIIIHQISRLFMRPIKV